MDNLYDCLSKYLYDMAESDDPDVKWMRSVFTTICLYYNFQADECTSDTLLMKTWERLEENRNIQLSFYSKYADDDRDDEYEEADDSLMARYENGFENYMLKYII